MLYYTQSELSGTIKNQSVYDSDVGVSGETSINLIAVTSPLGTQLCVKQILCFRFIISVVFYTNEGG